MKTETREKAISKHLILTLVGLLLLISTATTTQAEVKMVQMKISGYLCGN